MTKQGGKQREINEGCRNLDAEKQHGVIAEKCFWPERIPQGGADIHTGACTHTQTHKPTPSGQNHVLC